jgi:hypothetical protein
MVNLLCLHGGSTQPLTHNDDESDVYGTKSFKYNATYMPKAKSSSSNRIRAASIASAVKHNKKSGKARRNQNRRANKKNKKQCFLARNVLITTLYLEMVVTIQILLYYPSSNQSVIK